MSTASNLGPDLGGRLGLRLRVQPRLGQRILVVDDEPLLLEFFARALASEGYEVATARDAEQALELLRSGTEFSMLLSDVDLPELSGVELARWAGSIQPIVPALLMSTAGKDYLVDRGVLSPDSELLSKPFTLSTLLAKIEQVLEPTEGRPECNAARTGRDRARE